MLLALLALLLIAAPTAVSAAPDDPTGTEQSEPAGEVTWSPEAAIGELRTSDWAVMPGSVAVIDRTAVEAAIGDSGIKVLVTPFSGLSEEDRDAQYDAISEVRDAIEVDDVEVIEVTGLSVGASIFDIVPSDLAELHPVLERFDVTGQVVAAAVYLQTRELPDDAPQATPATAATAAEVAATVADLRRDPVVVRDGAVVDSDPEQLWRNRLPDGALRLVVMPPIAVGSDDIGPTAADLAPSFPGETVVVLRGRWIDIAGPDQQELDSAVAWSYGFASSGLFGWELDPGPQVALVARRLAEIRSGVVTDQATPDRSDPLGFVLRVLPFVALATVLVLVVVTLRRRSQERVQELQEAADAADRRAAAAARLPDLAAGILALDGLARTGTDAGIALERASRNYREARQILTGTPDSDRAGELVDTAGREIATAADLLDVPNVPGALR
ncbi:hypothetical protein GIS00_25260 [Nakamurella sp. YIM 132087]|uniref:DUF4350 domain-containing protein n=1 Tax=Nakamurella alba TaxID=2665158 RepID=A0A7K1FWP1_9ACTN|nr:hypothetical protein [Nakamurella alba]MTD17244.1 hypothetical protein [Nakamurella alba]